MSRPPDLTEVGALNTLAYCFLHAMQSPARSYLQSLISNLVAQQRRLTRASPAGQGHEISVEPHPPYNQALILVVQAFRQCRNVRVCAAATSQAGKTYKGMAVQKPGEEFKLWEYQPGPLSPNDVEIKVRTSLNRCLSAHAYPAAVLLALQSSSIWLRQACERHHQLVFV